MALLIILHCRAGVG